MAASKKASRLAYNATEARHEFEAATSAVASGRCEAALERYGEGRSLLGRAMAAAEEFRFGELDRASEDDLATAGRARNEAEDAVRAGCLLRRPEPRREQGSLFGRGK